MNTIPLIFNERQIDTVILGGKEPMNNVKMNVGIILLNGGGSHYRIHMLETLMKGGYSSIVSVETDRDNYNIEDFVQRFPCVKFVVPLEEVTTGDMINISMREVDADYVLVIRDTLVFEEDMITPRLFQKLTEYEPYCIVPRLNTSTQFSIPVWFSPSVANSVFSVNSSSIISDGVPTLYPFDYIGLYNKKKFIQLGGYDYTIKSPYWQNLDLSFRAWLWGERITLSTGFNLSYGDDFPSEDNTATQDSRRFYLKNLMPRYIEDHGIVLRRSFFLFWLHSSCGFFEALSQFSDAKQWVEKNKYRFRRDAAFLVEKWGNI